MPDHPDRRDPTDPVDPTDLSDLIDLSGRLDAAIGVAPTAFGPDRTTAIVAAGRRARTRHRTAVGTAVLGVVLLVGGGLALGAAGGDRAGTGPTVATDPPAPGLLPGERVALTLDGRLMVRPGVEVLQRVPDPLGSTPPAHSLGLAVRDGDTTYWYLLDSDGRTGTGSTSDEARRAFPTLRDWLHDQAVVQSGQPGLALVRFTADGRLAARAGVTLVQQRTGVRLGTDFAGPDDPTAVAEVRWRGATWFVAARRLPGSDPEYLPTAGSIAGPTLDDFLAYARTRYSERGAGLR